MTLATLDTVNCSIEGTATPATQAADLTQLMLVMVMMGMMSAITGQMEV